MSEARVIRSITRAGADVIEGLQAAGVATVHEAGADRLLPPSIRPIQQDTRIAGSAVTVSCAPGDNIMIHAAVEVIEAGDVLVVEVTAPSNHGMFGELLAVSVVTKGCRGLVIDAGVRDVADLRQMGFPVWTREIHAAGTAKATPGSVNVPISIGGVTVAPGDVIVADDDGVAVVERERAAEVLEAANQRIQREEETRARLAAGELGLDFYGFRSRLEDLGVSWLDSEEE